MTIEHCRDDALLAYQFGACSDKEERIVREHILYCPPCQRRLDDIGREVSTVYTEPSEPDLYREDEFLGVAERIASEERYVDALLDAPLDELLVALDAPGVPVAGMLRLLGMRVRERLEQDTHEALTLAERATRLGDRMMEGDYPRSIVAQVRGNAWVDYANVLRHVSRLDESLAAIGRAEQELDLSPALSFDRAIAGLVKAMLYRDLDKPEEALELVRRSEKVFLEHGDQARFIDSGIVEAMILFSMQRVPEAREKFRSLLAPAEERHDFERLARLHNNLGHCSTNMQRYTAANVHFVRSRALFADLGMDTEAARAQWGIGNVLVARGLVPDGIAQIAEARRCFHEFGMDQEAALTGLEIVEHLLESGHAAKARSELHLVFERTRGTSLGARAVEALAWLRDALARREAGPELVRHVRAYVESLSRDSERAFTLPA